MKLLYVAGRWDPTIQNEYSGSDYGAYHMLKKQPGVEITLVEPIEDDPLFIEKLIMRIYQKLFKKRLIKYYPSLLRKIGKKVNQAIQIYQPDVIFSKYSSPIVHARIDRPFVYMCDSTVHWTKKYWQEFSKIGFSIMEKWENKSIQESDHLITFSAANADIVKSYYKKNPNKITVMPIPAYVPEQYLPDTDQIQKEIGSYLHLLLVGKRYHLRGMDIAIRVTELLNEQGLPTILKIVGLNGEDSEFVKFHDTYDKEDPQQISQYFDFFKWADLLIHPSRFHSAGIVISEAAAFGLPTITNASGGLATTVKHDETGLVLPERSSPQAYVEAIKKLIADQHRYKRYRSAVREMFDKERSWEVSGKRLFEIIQSVVDTKTN